tara:strand:- start:232 stop:423 length:192 start_codon:yes stop_codon:yes gene_type:complete
MKVTKESFYEATFKVEEEFDNAEIAAKSNTPSDNSKILIQDIKLEKTRIKLNNDKESVKDGFK